MGFGRKDLIASPQYTLGKRDRRAASGPYLEFHWDTIIGGVDINGMASKTAKTAQLKVKTTRISSLEVASNQWMIDVFGWGWRDFSAVSFQESLLEDDFLIFKSNSWKI